MELRNTKMSMLNCNVILSIAYINIDLEHSIRTKEGVKLLFLGKNYKEAN